MPPLPLPHLYLTLLAAETHLTALIEATNL